MQAISLVKPNLLIGPAVFAIMTAIMLLIGSAHKADKQDIPKLDGLDAEVYEFFHPTKPAPGLKCDRTVLYETLPLVIHVLNLPENSDPYTAESIIERRLLKAQRLGLSAHDEACLVLGMDSKAGNDILLLRLELLNSFWSLQRSTDPRYGTHCAGFTWNIPFKLLRIVHPITYETF